MRSITHREMRNNSGEILRAVAAGETIQITNGGRIAAVISPPGRTPLDQLVADGSARPARRGPDSLVAIHRRKSMRSSEELISDVRGRW